MKKRISKTKNKLVSTVLAFAMLVSLVGGVLAPMRISFSPLEVSLNQAEAAGESWLTGWSYRREITITNPQTDFQTKVEIQGTNSGGANYVDFGKVLANGADVRFTDSGGSGALYYWIESWVDTGGSEAATIWVRTHATTATPIYMYYGKSDASDGSDKDATLSKVDKQIVLGTDDTSVSSGGAIFNTETWIKAGEFIAPPTITYDAGLRWQNITIPKADKIYSAEIKTQDYTGYTAGAALIIKGEDADDALTFSDYTDFTGRTRTTASVGYTATTGVDGIWKTLPDIKTVIQEIIDRAGWVSGNDLVCFIEDNGSVDRWLYIDSYETAAADSPEIIIYHRKYAATEPTASVGSEEIPNSAPVASSVSIDSAAVSVTLTENTTKSVVCTATVTDADGFADIDSVEAKLYRSGVGVAAADTPASHYTLTGDTQCVPSGGSGNTETYTCSFAVQFYADPTDAGTYVAENWVCQVTPTDGGGAGTLATDDIEMNTLTALNVTSTIVYGTVNLDANTGTADQTTIVTNTGNEQIDIQLDGYGSADGDGFAMTCTTGTVTIGNERYSLTASVDWATKTQLTDTAFSETAFNLAKGATSTKNVYWGIGMPTSGLNGTCSGKVNFTAVSG